ncbi:MAG: gluconate 2-dehydrogenase subunit 3 family protein [Sphingobacteriales bacterium]|nr:gluconate 2-dehydrogenase subunit 3 family protein [Sphingobacteriales bacterium]MBI3719416.1 gluconate 2-dehydrogenase subunit 3 family protein [Sphingobacteriales bacterium]
MDRRQSLKTIALGTLSAGLIVEACKTEDKKTNAASTAAADGINRMAEEKEYEESLVNAKKFFTPEEMATITVLANIIIPKDEVSGSASEAKVPDFIEFIVKDMPQHQTPIRGGLRWLDLKCLNLYGKSFTGCTAQQQIEMVDAIAYPKKAKPENQQGVAFFNLMRNLTATGFYSTKMGWDDVGYKGNTPNQWNGVPDDVLKQYGVAYSERELKECISFDKS